jgi:RHS repeat-associated protein
MAASSRLVLASTALAVLLGQPAPGAPDKSGVKPTVLSLPSGPGSIEGLGESFEPQLNSGTSSYSVKLTVPPGRAGFDPELALSYNSGSGNGVLGLGWKLSVPELQRQTDKGLPRYAAGDTVIYSNGEELVPVADGSYRCRNEAEFIRFERDGDGWVAHRRDGTVLRFGSSASSRIASAGKVFAWKLDGMSDTNGNTITYSYRALDASAQRYLDAIGYNPSAGGGMSILFEYEQRPDPVSDYRPTFELLTAWRCSAVVMKSGGAPVRGYRLAYAGVSDTQPVSLLASITQVGRDGTSTLPPATFGYVSFERGAARVVSMPTAPAVTLNDANVDLLDVDADGLADILDTSGGGIGGHVFYPNLGPAGGSVRWGAGVQMAWAPAKLLGSGNVQLADVDGDGRTEMLDKFGQDTQVYALATPPGWQPAGFITQGTFDFADTTLRLVDLNNDKLTDALRIDTSGITSAYLNLQEGRWSSSFVGVVPAAGLTLDRPDVRLADMNGDRLADLVRLDEGVCIYYAAEGFGMFAAGVPMAGAPLGVVDPARRLQLVDVNGDGRSDVINVRDGAVDVYINLGLDPGDPRQGRLAPPFTVLGPYTDSTTVFRQADVNGNGSTDLLWNTPGSAVDTWAFLDFAPGEQPYQLEAITNGIGRTTTISYGSSTDEMVRDRDAGRPWPVGVPFPVPVVTRIEVKDGRESVIYATELRYHDGYYDGAEKEFRGFAAAERIEIGSTAQGAPTLVTGFTFDTGAATEALKGKPLTVESRTETGQAFEIEKNTWTVRPLLPGPPGDACGVVFAYLSATAKTITERGAGAPVLLQSEYAYDDWGNLTQERELGRVEDLDGSGVAGDSEQDRRAWNDERFTRSTYSAAFPAGQSHWILDEVVESETLDGAGKIVTRTRNYYDDETFSGANLGGVSRGNLTMTREWFDPTQGDAGGWVPSARNRYDEWGNLTGLFDPLWGTAPGHWRAITYDDVYRTFPVRETIYTGNPDAGGAAATIAITAGYDPGLGMMTSAVDFNGFTTTYGYDTFGRLTSIVKPGDSASLPTVSYDYVLAHDLGGGKLVNWVETHQREVSGQSGSVDSRTFYDGLGRKIMTRAEGEDPAQVVVTDTVRFNARQGEWKTYLPYFDTGTLDFVEPTFNAGFTEHEHDALGREIRVFQPAAPGTSARVFSLTAYEPLVKLVQDEEQTAPASPHHDAAIRYVTDGRVDEDGEGRLREVHEIVKLNDDGTPAATPQTWVTAYRYDTLDDLTGYTDSQRNSKQILYDGLKRRIFMNDPDRGWTWYAYDAAGNVARTRDAKGQEIAYAYDGVNRLQVEYFCTESERTGNVLGKDAVWGDPGPLPSRTPDVAYHYDVPFGPVQTGYPDGPAPKDVAEAILGLRIPDLAFDLNGDGAIDAADLPPAANQAATASAIPRDWHTARNAKGSVAWVRDLSGQEYMSYDERGRVEWVVKRIDSPETGTSATFKTANRYDAMDRVTTLVYPDMSTADYAYNRRGLLESIQGVVPRADYNPAGQLSRLDYACGTTTTYEFDHRLRLSRLATRRERDGVWLQDLRYAYDAVSNITAINDARTAGDLTAIGHELLIADTEAFKFSDSAAYTYDDVYRLTGAANPAIWGSVSFRYDRIGNMVRKDAALAEPVADMNLGEMAYGGGMPGSGNPGASNRAGRSPGAPPGPHAFTLSENAGSRGSAPGASYDSNGNAVRAGQSSFTWDSLDHLVRAATPTADLRFSYDFSGVRTTKAPALGQPTLTPSEGFEVRNGAAVRHVFFGDRRVLTDGIWGGRREGGIFHLRDHVLSAVGAVGMGGSMREMRVYFPFGTMRKLSAPGIPAVTHLFQDGETDLESGLVDFKARYYWPTAAAFLSVDPVDSAHLQRPARLGSYSFADANPLRFADPEGKDAIALVYTDYRIGTPVGKIPYLGHAGVVIIEKSGRASYFEYGRYDKKQLGIVKTKVLAPLKLDRNGQPTPESLRVMMKSLLKPKGKGGEIKATYYRTDLSVTKSMLAYARSRVKLNKDPGREGYGLLTNNCGHFMKAALEHGGIATPMMADPRPNSYIHELQGSSEVGHANLDYTKRSGTLNLTEVKRE